MRRAEQPGPRTVVLLHAQVVGGAGRQDPRGRVFGGRGDGLPHLAEVQDLDDELDVPLQKWLCDICRRD